MNKISDLEDIRVGNHPELNEQGVLVDNAHEIRRKRPVKVVEVAPRIGHFVVDWICASLFIILISKFEILGWVNSGFGEFVALFGYPLYYFVMEALFGRTIGKLITRTVVIDEQAKLPSLKKIFLRTIIRCIPFEFISCFKERGWHDQWTGTYVVPLEEKKALQQILKDQGQLPASEQINTYDQSDF